MSARSDIAIVGGGLVGAALAAGAARAGLNVVVLDAGAPPILDTCEGWFAPRVVALARRSQRFLKACGAWDQLDATRCQAYRAMRVWDAAGAPFDEDALSFEADELGEPNLGFIVENDALAAAAYRAAVACSTLQWRDHATVRDVSVGERAVRLTTEQGESVSAALVVAADGARSSMRAHLGVAIREGDYEQRAVVAHVDTSGSHLETAWQRFLPSGPLALLPLADGTTSIVWSTSAAHAEQLMGFNDEVFCQHLEQASAGVLGEVQRVSRRHGFPLTWLHAERYTGARFALAGDAAHVIHPLAGLGANLGLQDAEDMVNTLSGAQASGRDLGDGPVLRPYARRRRADNALMMSALTQINRLFAGDQFALSLTRRFGLRSVNRLLPLKRWFARRAMG
ncbi:MAG: FAD-dependent monooxygenase [Pseudomonadota bacterium]